MRNRGRAALLTLGVAIPEAGGTRLAVLKLRPGPDWPCKQRTLSHRSAFGKLARCRISETLAEGFRPTASLFSFRCHIFPFPPFVEGTRDREHNGFYVTLDIPLALAIGGDNVGRTNPERI